MEFQELVEIKTCPDCGAKCPSAATRCGVCGTDLQFVPANREMETMSSIRESSLKGGPPPPPPGAKQEKPAPVKAKPGFLKRALNDFVVPLVFAFAAVGLLISVGKKQGAVVAAGPVQALDKGAQALDIFMNHRLGAGEEKGKSMRQFWSDYQKIYELAQGGKPGEPSLEIGFFQQPSAAAGVHNVFVTEKTPDGKVRALPFSVTLENNLVAALSKCAFTPGTGEDYTCADPKEMFPEGI